LDPHTGIPLIEMSVNIQKNREVEEVEKEERGKEERGE
jgi:hypothetical protein